MLGHSRQKEEFSRLVENDHLQHAYIFFGPEGTGKRAFAESLAAYLETDVWPVEGEARNGRPEDTSVRPLTDTTVFEPEEGTIGIDISRRVREFLGATPLISKRRTAILDHADAMTTEAGNALLKVAEEPPLSALLILILRDPEQIPETLTSRFQKIYFGPLPEKEVAGWLVAEHGLTAAEATRFAKISRGQPGLALSLSRGKHSAGEALAEAFLVTPTASRKEFLKELLAPEDFSLAAFLDDLIRVLARDEKGVRGELWHPVLELRQAVDISPLNPKIQLLSLWTFI